jgi:acetyl esterase
MAALAAVSRVVARRRVAERTLEELQAERGWTLPDRPPFTWMTGGVDRSVGITYGTARARDGYDIPLRIYRPRSLPDVVTDVPVVVYLHGGGFVDGNVVMYDPMCSQLATGVRAVVVSVDYRLAPEHRAPTGALDAVDATRWVAGHGEVLRADTTRVALCGDSAGATLAAVAAQVLRDEGVPWLRHQALVYPGTDLTLASPSIDERAQGPFVTKEDILTIVDLYLADGADRRDPLISPLFGRLDGLPPTLVQTADLDPLRDDGLRFAAALEAAGVPVRLTNYVRVPHGFAYVPGVAACGPQQRAELVGELRRHLYAVGAPSGPPAS